MKRRSSLIILLVLATLLTPATPRTEAVSVIGPEGRFVDTPSEDNLVFSVAERVPLPQQQCTDKYEPNDSFSKAWPLSPGTIASFVCDSSDYDYYSFSVAAGNTISATLGDLPDDYNLCLFDPAQGQLECSGNPGTKEENIQRVASTGGTHYLLVYGVQGAASMSTPYVLTLEVNAPDLTITDIWEDNGQICYQVWNSGSVLAPSGVATSLTIDLAYVMDDTGLPSLAPDQRLNRCFNYAWQCSLLNDGIKVTADSQQAVAESDESNNSASETWLCDDTPPVITAGPSLAQVLDTSAVIEWTTDESAGSVVRYGRQAGTYDLSQSDGTSVTGHKVTLKGLTHSTVYHYVVESSDASGNVVTSGERFFKTASPQDSEPPDLLLLTVTRIQGPRERYRVAVPVSDTVGVERVEFYMNGSLIGIDYTPDLGGPGAPDVSAAAAGSSAEYSIELDPNKMHLTRKMFFSNTHSMAAWAFDQGGLKAQETVFFEPSFEPSLIDLSFWPAHDVDRYVEGPSGTLPPGETLTLWAQASEQDFDLDFPGPRDIAVERVVFEIDGSPVYTSYPSGGAPYDHYYAWDIGGLGVGTHTFRARAYAEDGGSLASSLRRLHIVAGTPSIEVTRNVVRTGHHFQVQLTVENRGTATAVVDHIRDNVTGFQAIAKTASQYEVSPEYWVETRHCDVEIDVFGAADDVIELSPGASLVVEYLAVPILYDDWDTYDYGIGAWDDVKIWDASVFRWRLDRAAELTDGGESLSDAVAAIKAASDYLVVTHPRNLFFHNASRSDVDTLLSTMAELVRLKTGILGYVADGSADDVLAQVVAWGDGMTGSDGVADHHLSNGYLLLVGEAEILGSWNIDFGGSRGIVHHSDLPYGNTSGRWRSPELVVSRIIGNNAADLTIPIQASINVFNDVPGFEFHREGAAADAFLIAGGGDGASSFEGNVDDVEEYVDDEFATVVRKLRDIVGAGGNMTDEFRANDGNVDLFFYRDHCGPTSWSGVITTGTFIDPDPIDFEDSTPFAFACCCQAGKFEGDGESGIAETFLKYGAGAYIGATENSARYRNNQASEQFFDAWVGSTESVGKDFRDLKRNFNGTEGKRFWIAEYNMYGDPKYGSIPDGVTTMAMPSIAATAPLTSLQVVVPDYVVATMPGNEHQVTVPGGGLYLEEGEPPVPLYTVYVDYAPGWRVQDVTLVGRSGLSTTTGLNIAAWAIAWDDRARAIPAMSDTDDNWWPQQAFDWEVQENADGSTRLVISLLPFRYNAATTGAEFYPNYDFDIAVLSTTIEIAALTTDRGAYGQGDEVQVELSLANSGAAQDLIVSAVVKAGATDDTVGGLFLQSLNSMTGTASVSAGWDSTGIEPGTYRIEAEVRDQAGHVLDREIAYLKLGVCAGEITDLAATPGLFRIGDAVAISMTFHNTGTVPITGTAVIQVQDAGSVVVQEFRTDIAGLAPGGSVSVNESWDTTGSSKGDYRIIAYVLYDAGATAPSTASITTVARIYLPLLVRQ